jgi:hypothetical protein
LGFVLYGGRGGMASAEAAVRGEFQAAAKVKGDAGGGLYSDGPEFSTGRCWARGRLD